MYLSTSYDFNILKSYYAAVLREIELGKKSWNDDYQYIETAILSMHVPRNKNFPKFKKTFSKKTSGDNIENDEIWWCANYNRNKCQHKNNHILTEFRGRARNALHICATCWQKDNKKLSHPECSSACPHANAN